MEVPVIATDVGGTGEIVNNYDNGVLIKPDSVAEIAEKILEYYSQKEKYKAMAIQGRLDVIEKFSFANRTSQQMDIYQDMINCRR